MWLKQRVSASSWLSCTWKHVYWAVMEVDAIQAMGLVWKDNEISGTIT